MNLVTFLGWGRLNSRVCKFTLSTSPNISEFMNVAGPPNSRSAPQMQLDLANQPLDSYKNLNHLTSIAWQWHLRRKELVEQWSEVQPLRLKSILGPLPRITDGHNLSTFVHVLQNDATTLGIARTSYGVSLLSAKKETSAKASRSVMISLTIPRSARPTHSLVVFVRMKVRLTETASLRA